MTYLADAHRDWHTVNGWDTICPLDCGAGEVQEPPYCEWFAKCPNPADGVVQHPVLGAVPTCRRCADKLDLRLVVIE